MELKQIHSMGSFGEEMIVQWSIKLAFIDFKKCCTTF
jgi:hypothetical protein